MTFPSHSNSINGRNERRANWKAEMQGETIKEKLTNAMIETFRKNAVKTIAAGLVSQEGHTFKIKAGKRHYTVYKIQDSFRCECRDNEKYGDCMHKQAAALFAAEAAESKEKAAETTEAAEYIHVTNEGEHIPLSQMTDQHLQFVLWGTRYSTRRAHYVKEAMRRGVNHIPVNPYAGRYAQGVVNA